MGNGLSLKQSYDDAYRMTAQTTTGVLERNYPDYDDNGNRLGATDALTSNSSYTYDALNRLDTANGPFGNRSRLDADGAITTLAYAPGSNRLTTLGSTDVLLDANGNTLNQGNWTYSYSAHNRLTDATENATLKARFSYNGLGQRIHKTDEVSGTAEYVLYGSRGERLVETDGQGNSLLEYIYLNGQLLAVYAPDDDQDGTTNQQEARQGTLPINPDSDGDGLSNLEEWYEQGTDSLNPDSDGDGINDGTEVAQGTNPASATSFAGDGDINGNGETNLGDLVLLYQFVTGSRIPTAQELLHADMNRDGEINAADLLLLQQQLLQAVLGWPVVAQGEPPGRPERSQLAHANTNPGALDWLISPAQALPGDVGDLYYVHSDPLGTPQVLTDESGAVVWTAQYDPFGEASVNEDPDSDGVVVTLNARLPGQYYDQETGLHYNANRYYDPGAGRYITSDPIGLIGGLNTYLYANSNPIRFTDPLGLASCDGRWVKVRWVRNIGSVYTLNCTCYWSCTSCPGSGKGDAFPIPNMGQFATPGKIVFTAKPGVGFDPEGGDNCQCGDPGPSNGCDECKQ